jgi:hypothetical protein
MGPLNRRIKILISRVGEFSFAESPMDGFHTCASVDTETEALKLRSRFCWHDNSKHFVIVSKSPTDRDLARISEQMEAAYQSLKY